MPVLCPLCVQACFSSLEALRRRLINVANGPLACPICNEMLMGLDKLTIHLFSHTTNLENDLLAMTVSEKDTSNVAANNTFKHDQQQQQQSEIPLIMDASMLIGNLSNKTTTTSEANDQNLNDNSHSQTTANITDVANKQQQYGVNNYECPYCIKTFELKSSLSLHLKYEHNSAPLLNDNIPALCLLEIQPSTLFNTSKELNFPFDTEINASCSNVNVKDNCTAQVSQQVKKNDTEAASKVWKCNECSKSFTTKYFLKKHKRLHTGEMPYTCEICARTFTFQQSYHKHLMYHSDEKPHACVTCGRSFKELSTLHNHERIHSGEKPYKCEACGKSFRQRVSFLVHSRIHTGVMPYKCEICNKSFRYKVTQRTHKCQMKELEIALSEAMRNVNDTKRNDEVLLNTNELPQPVINNLEVIELYAVGQEAAANDAVFPKDSKNFNEGSKNLNEAQNAANLNELLSTAEKDNYLNLLDMQNINLFSPPETHSLTLSSLFEQNSNENTYT